MAQEEDTLGHLVRRSKLVVSPLDGEAVSSGARSGADALVLDLHRLSPQERPQARAEVSSLLPRLAGRGFDLLAWIDPAQAQGDLEACLVPGLSGVVLSALDHQVVHRVDRAITTLETARGLPRGQVEIDLVLASAQAVLDAYPLASASPRVVSLNLDPQDLAAELGVEVSEEVDQFFYARGRIIIVARLLNIQAHGLGFIPRGPSGDSPPTLEKAVLARKLGLRGVLCWDSREVPELNLGFALPTEEVEKARKMMEAMEEGIRQGLGAVSIGENMMVDLAMLKHARAVLGWAEAVARREEAKKGSRN